ncbi:hypothetical protein QOT17_001217 [Balamuthia mandrillaris]
MIEDIKTYNVLISSLLAQQVKNLDFWNGELPYYLTAHGTNNKDINSITLPHLSPIGPSRKQRPFRRLDLPKPASPVRRQWTASGTNARLPHPQWQ